MALFRCLAAAAIFVIASASAAQAQTPGSRQQDRDRMALIDSDRVNNELSDGIQPRDRRGRLLNPGQILAAAKSAAAAANLPCQVTEAALLGVTGNNDDLFEVACQTGPGYLITAPGLTQPFDCLVLADQAERMKADGLQPPPRSTCKLKGNQNGVAVIAGYAREAGVPCQVDAGAALGNDAYEAGCANADGFVIERKADGAWGKTPCWRLAAVQGLGCRYSTAAESNSAWTDILAGTEASVCSVEKTRQIGVDSSQLAVFEVKCSGAPGYLARVNAASKAERVHACSDPATAAIAGGCVLTPGAQ